MSRNPDITYGSIYASAADDETIVGLQGKLLFALNVLQSADARPTQQAMAAVETLAGNVAALVERMEAAR